MELLAPAGDIQNLEACINCGADAVYLGMSDFNARIKAENFNKDNIKKMVQKCHLFGIKVYITVNTLVKNSELNDLLDLINCLVDAKVDAFIVQDFGVVKLLKDNFQNIVLHASTQMGIHNLDGAKFLEKLGFSRVVLSRETKLEDIIQIKQNTKLEIEYFVQGALCVCFSGNCYLSSLYSGNSGNRGKCMQLCRKPYTCGSKSGYYLSPRDLCLINNLKLLQSAGVDSLKIEGRLRRKSYVLQAVSSYRRALNNLNENDNQREIDNLERVFARGKYNQTAYLNQENNNIIQPSFPNHRGKNIGVVERVEKFKDIYKITIKSSHNICSQDGLKFVRNDQEKLSIGVGNVDKINNNLYQIYSKNCPQKNDKVYLSVDYAYESSLEVSNRKLPITIKAKAVPNDYLKVEFGYKDISVVVQSQDVLEKAKSVNTAQQDIQKSLNKLTDTNFAVGNIELDVQNVFVPKSIINDLRRKGLEQLQTQIIQDFEKDNTTTRATNQTTYNFTCSANNCNCKMYVVNEKNDIQELKNQSVIFSPLSYKNVNIHIDKLLSLGNTVYLNLPIIAYMEDVKLLDKIVQKLDSRVGICANNYWAMKYAKTREVIVGQFMNVFNNLAVDSYRELGVKKIIVSPEIKENELCFDDDMYQMSFGFFPVMTMAHCPYKTINHNTCSNCSFDDKLAYTDELSNSLKIRRIKATYCTFELLSGKPINATQIATKNTLLDLREFDNRQCENIINSARKNQPIDMPDFMLGWSKRGVE